MKLQRRRFLALAAGAAALPSVSRLAMAQWNADQVALTLRGGRPPRLLNPAAWTRYCGRFESIFGFAPDAD